MSGKRRHQEGIARREALEARDLLAARARGIAVNPGQLAPYDDDPPGFVARGFYSDRPFECGKCGQPQVWTAEQQRWWYEVAKGSVYSYAKFCRPCRQASRPGGDPNPYKSVGLFMAKVRSEVARPLLSRGFQFLGPGAQDPQRSTFLRSFEYGRADDLLSIAWNQHVARLTADLLLAGGNDLRTIAVAELSGCRSTADIDFQIEAFVRGIDSGLPDAAP